MEAFLISAGVVALGEMGDKTQLLALVLAARFPGRQGRQAIVAGIFAATLANHSLAAALGAWVTALAGYDVMRWIVGASFLAMAAWMLVPDKPSADEVRQRFGPFLTTLVAFFLVEMGDKTQIATVALAARFPQTAAVVAGTTLGMLLADVPVVFAGERLLRRVPIRLVHGIAAGSFALLGVLALL